MIPDTKIQFCSFAVIYDEEYFMKHLHLSALLLFFIPVRFVCAQNELAILNDDFEYFVETDEVGSGFKIISFYLKNKSENKLLFYNFKIAGGNENDEVVKPLPDDILLLEPHRTSKFGTFRITGDQPDITWYSVRLNPSVGFNKFPEQGKHYVFFWESLVKGNQTVFSYYLKNICDRRMKFYMLSLEGTGEYHVEKELPQTAIYLWPDSSVNVTRLTVPVSSEDPELNWEAIFTNFQPTGDDFCNELIMILEAAGEGDFGSVRGQGDGANSHNCTIKVPGIYQEMINNDNGKWHFIGQMGGAGLKKEIETRFREYFDRIDICIPDIIPIEAVKSKTSKNKSAAFSGIVDNKKYSGKLEVVGSDAQPNDYTLVMTIFAVE